MTKRNNEKNIIENKKENSENNMLCITPEKVYGYVEKIRHNRPLIHAISNIVTVNDCANLLLAIGASPTMAHHVDEVKEVTAKSSALVLNLGATECLLAMEKAGMAALGCQKPCVLDPVGVGSSDFRRSEGLKLMNNCHPTCIRGNYSEIKALAFNSSNSHGVDAGVKEEHVLEAAVWLAKEFQVIVCACGETDYITDGKEMYEVKNGSAWMPRLTGAGCMDSVLMGAFLSQENSIEAVAAASIVMGILGEMAEEMTVAEKGGIGTFHVKIMDAADFITFEDVQKRVKVSKRSL